MADDPKPTPTPEPEVKSKDLIERGLDFFFGRLGDAIHGATQGKAKDPQAKEPQAKDVVVETDGEAVEPPKAQGARPEQRTARARQSQVERQGR